MKLLKKRAVVFTIPFVLAIGLSLVFLIFIVGGGAGAVFDLSKLISSIVDIMVKIPPVAWIFIGGLFLLRMVRRQ